MKLAYITSDWVNSPIREKGKDYGGVGYYRAIKPAEYLRKLGHTVDVFTSDFEKQIDTKDPFNGYVNFVKQYDAVITKQVDNRYAAYHLIGACNHAKVPIIMDIDDNFLAVEKWQPAYDKGYKEGGLQRAYAMAALSMCNAVFVSTEPLKKAIGETLKGAFNIEIPIFVLPNCNDVEDWNFKSPKNGDKTIIGWHGSITHDHDLKSILKPIEKIMLKYPDVELHLMGGIREEKVREIFKDTNKVILNRISIVGGTPTWFGFPEKLMSMNWDIGICPILDIPFNHSKSHIKFMELAMKEIPVIASSVYPYKESIYEKPVIIDGVNGFLAGDWYEKLDKLISDKKLRKTLGKQAKNDVIKYWQYKDNIHLWEEAINSVIKGELIAQ